MKKQYTKPTLNILEIKLSDVVLASAHEEPTEPPTEPWELEILGDGI